MVTRVMRLADDVVLLDGLLFYSDHIIFTFDQAAPPYANAS